MTVSSQCKRGNSTSEWPSGHQGSSVSTPHCLFHSCRHQGPGHQGPSVSMPHCLFHSRRHSVTSGSPSWPRTSNGCQIFPPPGTRKTDRTERLASRVNDLSGARAFVTPEFVRCRPEWVTQAEPPEWQGSRALQETHWLQL